MTHPPSPGNLNLLYRAYDDHSGQHFTFRDSTRTGYTIADYGDSNTLEFREVGGVLYAICHLPSTMGVTVLVGEELVDLEVGPVFPTIAEAYAYIKGLTTR